MSDIGKIEFGPLGGSVPLHDPKWTVSKPHVCQPDPVLLARLAAAEKVIEAARRMAAYYDPVDGGQGDIAGDGQRLLVATLALDAAENPPRSQGG